MEQIGDFEHLRVTVEARNRNPQKDYKKTYDQLCTEDKQYSI